MFEEKSLNSMEKTESVVKALEELKSLEKDGNKGCKPDPDFEEIKKVAKLSMKEDIIAEDDLDLKRKEDISREDEERQKDLINH